MRSSSESFTNRLRMKSMTHCGVNRASVELTFIAIRTTPRDAGVELNLPSDSSCDESEISVWLTDSARLDVQSVTIIISPAMSSSPMLAASSDASAPIFIAVSPLSRASMYES